MQATENMKSLDFGEFFIRTNCESPDIGSYTPLIVDFETYSEITVCRKSRFFSGILFELCMSYNRLVSSSNRCFSFRHSSTVVCFRFAEQRSARRVQLRLALHAAVRRQRPAARQPPVRGDAAGRHSVRAGRRDRPQPLKTMCVHPLSLMYFVVKIVV